MNRGYFARKFIDPKQKYNFYEETSIWMRKKRKHRTTNGPQNIDIIYKALILKEKQYDLAKEYRVSQSLVSIYINKAKRCPEVLREINSKIKLRQTME